MRVKQLLIQYEGTSMIPTQLASKDTNVILDYVDFILRNSFSIRKIRIDFE